MPATVAPSAKITAPASQPHTTVARGRRLLRRVVACLALCAAVLVPAAPAQATTAGTVQVCFQSSYTLYSTTYWGPYNRTVLVDVWFNGRATQIGSVTPGTNGCLRQALPAGYHWRFRVYHYEAKTYYVGQTTWTKVSQGSYANLGTLRLSSIRG